MTWKLFRMIDMLRFLKPWEFSPVVIIVITAAGILYNIKTDKGGIGRQSCFWFALILYYIFLQTDFDYYAEHEFFMDRIQHSVLHHFAPFLIALSLPKLTLRSPRVLNNYIFAPLIFSGLIIFWLLPPVQFIAMLDWRIYWVMNLSLVINGLMFWSVALNSAKPVVQKVIMMILIIPPQIVIGLLLTFSRHEFYPVYSICGRAFDLNPITDQQTGGAIIWITAAMMAVAGLFVILHRAAVASPTSREEI